MDWREWYEWGQKNCGIGVGDKVRVLRKADSHEMGWSTVWNIGMDRSVGRIMEVKRIGGVGINLAENGFNYPFFVLELIEKAKPEPEVPDDVFNLIKQEDFGCAEEKVIKLVSKIYRDLQK